MDKVIEDRAAHYSFNIESVLFNRLPVELQTAWKLEIENAYRAGATEMRDNPTGGQLLHVCAKSSDRGRRECLNTLWYYPEMTKPKIDRNCLVEMEDGHLYIARWSGKLWSWADGFPIGRNENKDVMYSSWCSIDISYKVRRWCYVQDMFPENKGYGQV